MLRLLLRSLLQRIRRRRRTGLSPYYVDGADSRLAEARWHADLQAGERILELGCGRDLHTSLLLAVTRGKTVTAYDVEPLAEPELINFTLERLGSDRRIRSLAELEQLGIRYVVGGEPPPGPFDGIISTAVLEHLPEERFERIVGTLAERLVPGGLATAIVDYADHWSYVAGVDRTCFYYHPEWAWPILNNRAMYQNRLRHVDVVAALAHAGLAVSDEIVETYPGSIRRASLAARFARYGDAELAVMSARVIARKAP